MLRSTTGSLDFGSRREALDELDRLATRSREHLEAVRLSRPSADLLTRRFAASLSRLRATRDDVRRKFSLPVDVEEAPKPGPGDGDLASLRQALDDLMLAYAESLPIFADAAVVSRLASDMVGLSRLRTVIDMWLEAEAP